MVSKITIFEPHFEGLDIDTSGFGSEASSAEFTEAEDEEGGRSLLSALAILAVLTVGIVAAYRALQEESFEDADLETSGVREKLTASVGR